MRLSRRVGEDLRVRDIPYIWLRQKGEEGGGTNRLPVGEALVGHDGANLHPPQHRDYLLARPIDGEAHHTLADMPELASTPPACARSI